MMYFFAMIEKTSAWKTYGENWYLKWDYMCKLVIIVNHTYLPSVNNVDTQEVKYWYPSSILFTTGILS